MKSNKPIIGWRAWPGGLLGLVLLGGWRHLFFRGKIPVDGNLLRVYYPNWMFSRLWMTPFRWPLWNPFRNMGEPFLADPQTMAAYPISWLLNHIGNFHAYLCFWVLVHSAIAAVFIGKLVKRWYGDQYAVWAAAAVISSNACFMSGFLFRIISRVPPTFRWLFIFWKHNRLRVLASPWRCNGCRDILRTAF